MKGKSCGSMRGYTLIELLVVIAIIGVLSAVVLASLSSARAKGANAAVKANLANIRAIAELYYDAQTPHSYGTAFAANPCPASGANGTMFFSTEMRAAVLAAIGAGASGTNHRCAVGPSGTSYAISIRLRQSENGMGIWCVDSDGNSRGINSPSWSGGGAAKAQCPAS